MNLAKYNVWGGGGGEGKILDINREVLWKVKCQHLASDSRQSTIMHSEDKNNTRSTNRKTHKYDNLYSIIVIKYPKISSEERNIKPELNLCLTF
jgi:hypothetical protein